MRNFDTVQHLATGAFLRALRRRLLGIILLAVIPILGAILYQAKLARDVQLGEALEDSWAIVESVAIREARFIDSAKQLLTLLADISAVTGSDSSSCGSLLKQLTEHNRIYVDLGVADANGDVRCHASDSGEGGLSLLKSSHFRAAFTAKKFAIGDYQLHGPSRRKILNFAYPILDQDGAATAVIFAALDVAWIGQLAAEHQLPEGAALSILDSKGTVLARFPEPERWAGEHVPDAALFEMLQLRSQAAKNLVGLDGIDRLYAFKPLTVGSASGQIYVMVGVPKDVAFGPAKRSLARNLLLLFFVSLLATAVAWLIGSKFVIDFVKIRAEAGEAKTRLAAIVESSEDAIIGMTLDGAITSWNNGAESMFGYQADEVMNQKMTLLVPEDRAGEISQYLEIIKSGKGINRFETERLKRDGKRIYVSASLSPILDPFGNVVGASQIARDITLLRTGAEQLQAHATRLETLHGVAQDIAGTLSVNDLIERALQRLVSDGGFDYAFARFTEKVGGREAFGASKAALSPEALEALWRSLGDDFAQCVSQCGNPWYVDDLAAVPELVDCVASGAISAVAVLPIRCGNHGHAALTLLSGSARSFGAEDRQFLQALSRQIALALENAWLYRGSLQVNEDLRREIDERKRAERSLADFTAMVAHDLRSPLANVTSIVESVHDGLFGAVPELQKKWLAKVRLSCKGLIEHISDFLDLSKIDAGKLQLTKAPVDIGALLHDRLQECGFATDSKKIALSAEIDPRLNLVSLDRQRIDQVLMNLLDNACKFTEAGGEIQVGARHRGASEVVVWVKDSGVGIKPEDVDAIFEMYHQAQGGQESFHSGTGLGLAICKKIVEAHGGRIWVESAVGKGSTFYFSLPGEVDEREEQWAASTRQIHS
jgi:PAS domain S-box-containing protein